MNRTKLTGNLLINFSMLLLAVLAAAMYTFAAQSTVPTGPDTFTIVNTSRFNGSNLNGTYTQAEAGNVTGLIISETTLTQSWAAYYGNVSGTITMEDAGGNVFYNWQILNPTGEVYAANASMISWSFITCVNLTGNFSSNTTINSSTLERFFGINDSDLDGFNETFNDTFMDTTGFYVGAIRIDSGSPVRCPLAYTYVNNAYQTVNFKEVLLTDNASIIFTTLLNKSQDGFIQGSNDKNDFQMLVAENGHLGAEATLTPYYFFVELN